MRYADSRAKGIGKRRVWWKMMNVENTESAGVCGVRWKMRVCKCEV